MIRPGILWSTTKEYECNPSTRLMITPTFVQHFKSLAYDALSLTSLTNSDRALHLPDKLDQANPATYPAGAALTGQNDRAG